MDEADEAYRKYLAPDYIPIEAEAKKDRAALNKAEKNIAEKFASLKAAYEKPLARIDMNIKSIRNAIKEASGVVDSAVKTYEQRQKDMKLDEIEVYFSTKDFELVSLDRLMAACDSGKKWLNKGYSMNDIRKEIDAKIAEIYSNIKVLEHIGEYGMTAKALYLDTLDMAAAMRQVDTMKANAEKLAREKLEREERERLAQINANREELAREEQEADRQEEIHERVHSLVSEALDIPEPELPPEIEKPKVYSITLCFTGTEEQLRRLRVWMSDNGITYEKVA
jgi:hypothetical protein